MAGVSPARITRFEGHVEIVGQGPRVEPDMPLPNGTRILTGGASSRAWLDLEKDIGRIILEKSSEAILKGGDEHVDSRVDLTRGGLEAVVVKQGTRFAVSTVAGEVRVRGTQFKVRLLKEQEEKNMNGFSKIAGSVMLVTVTSGAVDVVNPHGALKVASGNSAWATEASAPTIVAAREPSTEPMRDFEIYFTQADVDFKAGSFYVYKWDIGENQPYAFRSFRLHN
jgi:hypothetical protein